MRRQSPRPDLELELPAKPVFVRTARHALAAFAHLHGLSEDVIEDLKIAVSEACTSALHVNLATAGNGGPAPIGLLASVRSGHAEIEVSDRGPGPEREVDGSPAELDGQSLPFDSAIALPLIRGLVDELEIVAREGGGSVVRMRILLDTGREG
jgi:serine/threonine-protein kinase RsbW